MPELDDTSTRILTSRAGQLGLLELNMTTSSTGDTVMTLDLSQPLHAPVVTPEGRLILYTLTALVGLLPQWRRCANWWYC